VLFPGDRFNQPIYFGIPDLVYLPGSNLAECYCRGYLRFATAARVIPVRSHLEYQEGSVIKSARLFFNLFLQAE
jgi:hypothetical protein